MAESQEVGSERVVFLGESQYTGARQAAVDALELFDTRSSNLSPGEPVEPGAVCFVSLPAARVAEEAVRLLRGGCHVFLDVEQPPPLRDLELMNRTADEAGVSLGISRPLRHAPGLAGFSGRADVAVLESAFGDEPEAWMHSLTDTIDLCMHLCGTSAARRVEASSGRRDRVWPVFGAFSIRFDNGALAIASLRRSPEAARVTRCILSQGADVQEREIALSPDSLRLETELFLSCLAKGPGPPVTVSQALACARLLDQVLALLR